MFAALGAFGWLILMFVLLGAFVDYTEYPRNFEIKLVWFLPALLIWLASTIVGTLVVFALLDGGK